MLNKEYIKFFMFEYAISIFIIKKSNNKLRVCVDYKVLNGLIIKNQNVLSLIRDMLIKLCFARYYSKFDIITIFNEIRMKKSDKKKTTFFIRYDFFEYVIMLFELYNASNTFQFFINVTLYKYLNNFCINYMNNILIYSKTREKYMFYVFKVFKQLQKTNLFLNINKYEFFVIKVKYLKLIITIENVKIDLTKIKVVVN